MQKGIIFICVIAIAFIFSCNKKESGEKTGQTKADSVAKKQITDEIKWLTYSDEVTGIAFRVPRKKSESDSVEYDAGIIRSLGWMKPSDQAMEAGLNEYLCYEDGFMLHIWGSGFNLGRAKDFTEFGNMIYKSNQLSRDGFAKYKDGREIRVENNSAFSFQVPAELNSKKCTDGFEEVAIKVKKIIREPAENISFLTAVYFTYKDHHFRILYDPNNATGKHTFESFRFL